MIESFFDSAENKAGRFYPLIQTSIADLAPSIVRVNRDQEGFGTAFLLEEDGYHLVSAKHCFEDDRVPATRKVILPSGKEFVLRPENAHQFGREIDRHDFIAFSVYASDLDESVRALQRGRYSDKELQDCPIAIAGFPYRYLLAHSLGNNPVVSTGKVTEFEKQELTLFRTDARVEEGISGGPVVDKNLRVVGVIRGFSPLFMGASDLFETEEFVPGCISSGIILPDLANKS
jgi:hypothetical protein